MQLNEITMTETAMARAQACADCGCVVIVLPISIDNLARLTRALPNKGNVFDNWLGAQTECIVIGSKSATEKARKILGYSEAGE